MRFFFAPSPCVSSFFLLLLQHKFYTKLQRRVNGEYKCTFKGCCFFFLIKAFLVFQTKKNHSESDYLVISPLPPSARQDLLIIQDS